MSKSDFADVVTMSDNKIQLGFIRNHEYTARSAKTHKDIAISMIFSGSGSFTENGIEYTIRPSYTYFRRPSHTYGMRLFSNVLHERFFILLPKDIYPMLKLAFPNIDEIPPVYKIDDMKGTKEKLKMMLCDIKNANINEFWQHIPKIFEMIKLLTPIGGQISDNSKTEYAKKLLSDEAYYNISIPDIAKMADINYNTLRAYFKKKYGISPHKYRISQKMEYAKSYLAGGKSISDTAYMLGFPDIYSFSKEFSIYTGTSPVKYKINHIL